MTDTDSTIDNTKNGFINYVFNFDECNKNALLNLFQYTLLAIPIIVIILKVMNHYIPDDDDTKSSLEIALEIAVSVTGILLSIWFINKIVRYIPTYSKVNYPEFNEINFIVPTFLILFTIKSKLGSKINILVERLLDLIEGKTNLTVSKTNGNDYKTTQPISQIPMHQPSVGDTMGQPKQNLETQQVNALHNMLQPQSQQPQQQQQTQFPQLPTNTSVPNQLEPMAASEAFSMFGGTSF